MNEWGYRTLGYPARVRDLLGPSPGGTSLGAEATSRQLFIFLTLSDVRMPLASQSQVFGLC